MGQVHTWDCEDVVRLNDFVKNLKNEMHLGLYRYVSQQL